MADGVSAIAGVARVDAQCASPVEWVLELMGRSACLLVHTFIPNCPSIPTPPPVLVGRICIACIIARAFEVAWHGGIGKSEHSVQMAELQDIHTAAREVGVSRSHPTPGTSSIPTSEAQGSRKTIGLSDANSLDVVVCYETKVGIKLVAHQNPGVQLLNVSLVRLCPGVVGAAT